MKKLVLLFYLLITSVSFAYAFTNSLDRENTSMPQNNNFAYPNSNTYTNIPNTPYIPKEHSSFEHSNTMYSNPGMNDTRYNSNCQFGQCIPGGHTPIYK